MKKEENQNTATGALNIPTTNIPTTTDKIVPKFCTAINIAVLNNKNLVMTLVYSEGNENAALIDRIVIDLEHAKNLGKVLNKIVEDAEK